jgi:dihydrofolate reductase
MRTVTFGVANSLDNFIAREDDGVDWLLWGDEAAAVTAEFWRTIDTVVMGRKTYEVAVKLGTPAYRGVKNYVFSRTLPAGTAQGVEIVAEDAALFVRRLKADAGKGICVMGGGELARSLLEADVIDEIGLNVHPVILGSGVPLFLPMSRPVDLELRECRPFRNGCVYVTYGVKHRADESAELPGELRRPAVGRGGRRAPRRRRA